MPYALSSDDVRLYYEEHGQGEPLVLVHGSLGDYRDWGNQLTSFSNSGFKTVVYSRRNHYPNSWRDYPGNYSLLAERDDLLALLKEFSEPANLVGHSYGGYVAALVARDYPDYVRKLVLIEPPIFTMLGEDKGGENLDLGFKFLKEIIEPARRYLRTNDFESAVRVFLDGITGINGVYDRLKPPFRQIILDNSKTALPEIEITPERDPFDCTDAGRVNSQTLLVKGEDSPKVLQSITIELSKCIPNCKLVTIPKSSHGVIWDNPKIFNETVVQFLKRGDK
jgi:non-heme chloroperoxidase